MPADKRILAVHAHPDDETTSNGWTFPRYADAGAHITLVTSNLGEEGEILVPELVRLAAQDADQLGGYRMWELRAACAALGVSKHHFLGGPGRYRDSGMMGEPSNEHPRSFWQADVDDAARHVVEVIRADRPQVLLTYNEIGGYGHPDHIQAHRVAMRAAELAADPAYAPELGDAWDIPKIYWGAVPRSVFARALAELEKLGETGLGEAFGDFNIDEAPFLVDDAVVTTAIDGSEYADQRTLALRAHATQVSADHPFFRIFGALGPEAQRDHYQLVKGELGPRDPASGWESDLFAGV